MRSLVVMAMFTSSLTYAAWNGYIESRDLRLDASGVDVLEIDAGAGGIVVTGVSGTDQILAKATIRIPADDENEARQYIASEMVVGLKKKRRKALLEAHFDENAWHNRDSAAIDLEVTVPQGLDVFIDDGSGLILVKDIHANLEIDDGSGSIDISAAKSVVIDDGSGPIRIERISGDVEVEDGSGNIHIRAVGGSVIIDDGSGRIDVGDVERDVDIVDDGSGSVRIVDVRGSVRRDD